MPDIPLDFRSDTLTLPTPGMREAMRTAPLGDDVFGEDPSMNALQERIADRLGKEAALFVPSGTMSNQIGLRVHCRPGDEFICEAGCHIYQYEQGGYAQLSQLAVRPLDGEFGVLRLEQFQGLVRPDNPHLVRSRLVCLENTHNRGGGRILPYGEVEAICRWAHDSGLMTHLDGARLFNAEVATGISGARWASHFDTVSVCFSKGLGAPVGSALCGPKDLIDEAIRHRKLFGGGMRQAGVLAAAALYALENQVERLADDNARAQRLAAGIAQLPGLRLRPEAVDTNIVIFAVDAPLPNAGEFTARLAASGLKMLAIGPRLIRAVTHLDVNDASIDRALDILAAACEAGQVAPLEALAASPYV